VQVTSVRRVGTRHSVIVGVAVLAVSMFLATHGAVHRVVEGRGGM